jgi:glucose-1-phosphate cytidylyltransferase
MVSRHRCPDGRYHTGATIVQDRAMKVVILAGGLGTRLSEETNSKPKPMVEIGDRPILWHIMKLYADQGWNEFVTALGYRGDVVKRYFLEQHQLAADLTIALATGQVTGHHGEGEDWLVHLVDTGLHTSTGGRLKRLASWLGRETFMMTYGDGLADIDLDALLRFHRSHGKLATVTAVRPPARFGALVLDGDRVGVFSEKPQADEGWINGGFFVLEPRVLEYIDGDETTWEREPIEQLVDDDQLHAYRHEGFWQGVDTLRDVRLLEALWAAGNPPWRRSDG